MGVEALGGPVLQIGGGIASSIIGSNAAKKAAQQRQAALEAGIGEQRKQYAETVGRYAPYEKFGGEQLNALSTFLKEKDPSQFLDPGYEFRREQGMRGVEGTAAGRGMLKSGDTLRALTQYGQDAASQEYGNAFNRYLQQGNQLGGFASNFGMGSARDLGQFGQNNANAISRMLTGQGEAQAQGTQQAGQAWGDFAKGTGQTLGGAFGTPTGPTQKPTNYFANIFGPKPGSEGDFSQG